MRTFMLGAASVLLAGCMGIPGLDSSQTETAAVEPPVTDATQAEVLVPLPTHVDGVPVPTPKPIPPWVVADATGEPQVEVIPASAALQGDVVQASVVSQVARAEPQVEPRAEPQIEPQIEPQASAPATPSALQLVPSSDSVNAADCYTVDLFTPEKVRKPKADVPAEYRAFLGRWSGGAWNNVWCHDLLVYDVHKDGTVDLVEMHAPYEPWNQPATAFNRKGRIDGNGILRFSQGVETTAYRLENGFVVGTRSGLYGDLVITLFQGARPPVPQPKPVKLAQVATSRGS